MAMNQQKIRDSLNVGDVVNHLVQVAPGITKKRPLRVTTVMRAAVRGRFLDDGRETTIQFGELDFSDSTPTPAPKRRVTTSLAPQLAQVLPLPTPPALVKPVEPAPPPAAPAPAPVAKPAAAPNATAEALREFSAIVEMAAAVEAQLGVAQAELLRRAKALNAEKAAIERELEALAVEQRELDGKLATLRQLRR